MSSKNPKSDWLYVPVPRNLLEEIDKYIKKHPELGYRSRAEFVRRLIVMNLK